MAERPRSSSVEIRFSRHLETRLMVWLEVTIVLLFVIGLVVLVMGLKGN
jgi:hypothetical protein